MNLPITSIPTIRIENDIVILSSPKAALMGKIDTISEEYIILRIKNQKYQISIKDVQSIFFGKKQNTKITDGSLKDKNGEVKTQKTSLLNLLTALFLIILLFLMAVG